MLKNNNYQGFTLLEYLVALLVFSCICGLFSGFVQQTTRSSKQVMNTEGKQWQIFLIQLENELAGLELQQISSKELLLLNRRNQHKILIQFKGDKVIKRDNGGYQPLLTGLSEASFQQQDHKISIQATFENQQVYLGAWVIPSELANE